MPLQSMTGYARLLKTSKLAQYQIEMRSVNSKSLNLNIRLPRLYAFLEAEIHKIVSQVIKRGKVDFSINIKIISDELSSIDINEELAKDFYYSLDELRKSVGIGEPLPFDVILSNQDIVTQSFNENSEKIIFEDLVPILMDALEQLKRMRLNEGQNLERELLDYLNQINEINIQIEKEASGLKQYYRDRMRENLDEFLLEIDKQYAEDRLEFELALLAERADINEEIDRIKSHCSQMINLVQTCEDNDTVGTKLVFYCQELGREFNTIGSKNRLKSISNLVIDAKSIVNSIKEQVYNIQ
ncbi:MAG: YicC/YloC family endoribonuclease [Thermotogota bacterium]